MQNPSRALLAGTVSALAMLLVVAGCDTDPIQPEADLMSDTGTVLFHPIDEVDIVPGGEGCTPGFWRQPHHFHHWPAGTSPERRIDTDRFGDTTFLDGLTARGGHLNALFRHAVAAFLNASHPDIDFGITPDQVRSGFFEAVDSGVYEPTKDIFEALNEQGCPLSGRAPGPQGQGQGQGQGPPSGKGPR